MSGYHIFNDHRYSTHCAMSSWPACFALSQNHRAHLDREVSAIDIVSQKEIPRVGRVASDFEQLHQVILRKVSAPLDSPSMKRTYCPCMSPQTVMGASTSKRFGSERKMSPPLPTRQ